MWQHNYEPVAGSLGRVGRGGRHPHPRPVPDARRAAQAGVDGGDGGAGVGAARRARRLRHAGRQLALISTVYGAAYGLFPIAWIVFTSIMLYRLAVDTGKFEIIKDSVGGLTDDRRLQAMFIAFSFGAFIEGAAGFGAPVAVSGAMLAGLGFNPFYAAGICLLANTAPVAFGSIGIPVTTLANVTRPAGAAAQRHGRPALRDDLHHHPGLSDRRDGRRQAGARGPAGHRRLRRVVCRHAVLRLELPGARAHRHHQLADLHRRDGGGAQAVEAEEHHAARGRHGRPQ